LNKIGLSFFIMGLFFGSGTCLASCGPAIISYVVGTRKGILKGLLDYFLFSLARVAVYLILSLAFFFLGQFIVEQKVGDFSQYIFFLAGCFIIFVGLLVILGERLEPKLCSWFKKDIYSSRAGAVIMGLCFGLAPCAPLLAMLSYAGLISRSWTQALLYGFYFGMGTVFSPLILLVLLVGFIPRIIPEKKSGYNRILSFISGLVIIYIGTQLIIRAF